MTREEIIRMAREAGLFIQPSRWFYSFRASMDFDERVERFAALVAEHERAATREPATMEQVIAAHGQSWGRPATPDFFTGFRAAERFHGIRGSK